MAASSGVKKNDRRKYPVTVNAVNPVRPPSLSPVDDSTNTVTGEVPSKDPTTIDVASAMNAKYWPSKSPFRSVKPAD